MSKVSSKNNKRLEIDEKKQKPCERQHQDFMLLIKICKKTPWNLWSQ